MKKIFTAIILIGAIHTAFAQSVLRGKVTDATSNAPLPGANIQATGGGGTITDRDGAFSIPCTGSMELTISYVGYQTITQTAADCGTEIVVSLQQARELLSEVEITDVSTINRSLLEQPASIVKIGTPEIKRSLGLFMDDAINTNVPGVFMQRRTISAGQQFNIRGYGGGGPGNRGVNNNFDQLGVKAYLNGIPITDAEGVTLMDDIDFGSIGNVEVAKGPTGSLYGLAIAGVLNFQTIKPEQQRVSVGQDAMFGSYGLNRFTTHLQVSEKGTSVLVNYGKQNYSGFAPHTSSTKDFVNVMGDFQLSSKQTLTTYVGYSNSYDNRNGELTPDQYHSNDFSGNPAYIKNDAHTNVISFRAGIGHTYHFTKDISNFTTVFGTGLNSNVSSAGGWTDKAPVNYGFRTVFNTRFTLGNMKLSGLTGAEGQQQYATTIAYNMVANAKDPAGYNIIGAMRSNQATISGTYSLFTQWTLTLPQDLLITAGLGTSFMDITLNDRFYVAANNVPGNTVPTKYQTSYKSLLSPTLSINKVFNKHLTLYASYNKAWRAPVAANIYTPLAATVNTSLQPENGTQYEIGSKGGLFDDKLTYEIAYFNSFFDNKMTTVAVPNAAGTATAYTYVTNNGKLNNRGVEVLIKYLAYQSATGFIKSIRPFTNYAWSDFVYDKMLFQNNALTAPSDYAGKSVAGVPRHVVNAGIDLLSNSGLYWNATYQFRDVMPFTPDGLNMAPCYSLVNSKIGFRKRFSDHYDLDVFAGANNITGVKYYMMVFVNQLPDAYLVAPNEINFFGGVNFKYVF